MVFMVQVLFLGGVVNSVLAAENTQQELPYITEQLLEIESKRLSAPKEFVDELIQLADKNVFMSQYQQCHFKFLQSYATSFKGEHQKAIVNLEQLLSTCTDLRALIRIHAMLSNIYVIGGQFEKALFYMDQVIESAEKTDDIHSRTLAYSAAAIVYNSLNQTDLSQQYSQLLYKTAPTDSNQCQADYYQLRAELVSLPVTVEADQVKKVVSQCMSTNNQLMAYFLLLNLHRVELSQNDNNTTILQEIKGSIVNVEKDILQIGYKNLSALYYALKAQTESQLMNSEAAVELAQLALQINTTIGDSDQYIIAMNVLEQEAYKVKNFTEAYEYLKQKSEAEKRIFNKDQSKQMAFMTVKHANLAKGLEIEQLNKQNQVLELEQKLDKQKTNNQRLWIMFISTVLVFLMLWSFRMKKRHDYFKDVSEIDHLTKVLTRKAFEEQVNSVLTKTRSKNLPIHLAIMDLDFFKAVNDNHGHLIGDWVLKHVIYTCKEFIEEGMLMGRLGGEEFGLVMHGVSQSQVLEKIESMRSAIEKMDTTSSGVSLEITASFGVSTASKSGYTLPMLLTHADLALFAAKDKGRNQTVVYADSFTAA